MVPPVRANLIFGKLSPVRVTDSSPFETVRLDPMVAAPVAVRLPFVESSEMVVLLLPSIRSSFPEPLLLKENLALTTSLLLEK